MANDPIVERLIQEQADAGMSTRQFAEHLEIDPTLWSRIRRGERGMGDTVRRRVFRRFPSLVSVYTDSLTPGDGGDD